MTMVIIIIMRGSHLQGEVVISITKSINFYHYILHEIYLATYYHIIKIKWHGHVKLIGYFLVYQGHIANVLGLACIKL